MRFFKVVLRASPITIDIDSERQRVRFVVTSPTRGNGALIKRPPGA